jgi:hypothetical protein
MHGRILWQFREYIESRHGKPAWIALLKTAGLEERVYLAQAYPDAEAFSLLKAAVTMSGKSAAAVLQEFGEFTVPALLGMYAHLIKPEWRTLDVIEHAERVAHGAVRQHERGAAPPYLRTRRVNPHKVIMNYDSPRKMCAFAVGVGLGLGKHFHEDVAVQHNPCMYRGSDHCEITYTVIERAS